MYHAQKDSLGLSPVEIAMRHSALLGLLVLLIPATACSPGQEVYEKEMEVRGYDFTKYTEEGFLCCPHATCVPHAKT
jgi:hypothetical protein